MRKNLYLPGVSKRLFNLRKKKVLHFIIIFTTVISFGLGGNHYLKNNSTTSGLFEQADNRQGFVVKSYASTENITPEAPVSQPEKPQEVIQEIQIIEKSEISESKERQLTIDTINHFLKNKLKNKGEVIYNASKNQTPEVSAKLMTAIILLEVGSECNSRTLNEACNVGGLNWFKGCGYPIYRKWYMDFSKHGGVDVSINKKAEILSRYYIGDGRTNITSIGLKYAPPDDPRNGVGGMDNTKWSDNVKANYDKLQAYYDSLLAR